MFKVRAFYTALPGPLSEPIRSDLVARLSADYRRRLARLRDADARTATLAGLALLETALAESGLRAPPLAALAYPRDGQPHWREGPVFSLSHTDGLVVCAVADDPLLGLGIDVERLRPIAANALRHVRAIAPATSAGPAELLAAWTRAEAVLKAAGASLRDVREVRVSAAQTRATFAGRTWYLAPVELPDGFVGSLACDRGPFELRVSVAG